MSFNGYLEMDININGIDVTEITPMSYKPLGAIIYYHGYTSSRARSMFRCQILASMGYDVFVVEQLGHGSRKSEFNINAVSDAEALPKVLINTITESPSIVNYVAEKKGYNPNDIIFAGHSMGAMAAAGAFVKNPVGKLICYNGVLDYMAFADWIAREENISEEVYKPIKNELRYYSPAENLSRLENRPIILVDGALDEIVPPKFNIETASALKPFYKKKSLFKHIVLDDAKHQMTVKAMEFTEMFLESDGVKDYGK